MFLRYYGLREQPFSTTPDPRYLYMSASHREALASLIYGIETGRGFVSLIAEPGMGKTTLLFQLLDRFRNSARTVFLFQTQGDTREFLTNLISDLGLVPDDRDVSALQRQLNDILIQEARLGRQFVLVIDEAQNLEDAVLESVRMLSNFETSRSKLMQIVLAGQPGLADKLARPDLEQLMQRVSVICRLKPFNRQEVADYIDHRLRIAGHHGGRLFTPEAIAMIADLSEGIPRNVNNICFHALSLGYAKGQKAIDGAVIEEVYSDLELETLRKTREAVPNTRREPANEARGLEGVTLNGGRRVRADRGQFIRGGRYSPPTFPGMVGGGWPRRQAPRWPFWALTLLMLILAGELFWAQLPVSTRNNIATHLIAKTVGAAKNIAGSHSSTTTNGSSETPQTQTIATPSNARGNDVPEPVRKGAVEAAGPANIEAAKPDTSEADNQQESTAASGAGDTGGAAAVGPVSALTGAAPGANGDGAPADGSASAPTGTIVIESNVRGGIVTINGESNPGWRTPHLFDLPQGMYRISVSRDGYVTWYKVLQVTAGNKRWVTADLQLPRGVIVIDTEPPGMQVFIDGKAYGPSEVQAALDAGEHEFKVVPTGSRRPFEGSFVLKPGDILTRKVRWPAQVPQPTAGNISPAQKLKPNGKPLKEREQS
ncbi:MAG TPA: AAA family ATPase [Terriglobia bacterium]|nr:AAA family ATPase [Terriglobia bacterium]